MRDEYREQLSALVDDELTEEEVRFLVARLGRDEAASRLIGRYALISDALHGSRPQSHGDLAGRVSAALADEPAHGGATPARWRLLRPAAGMAVAASVALATIGLWPTPQNTPNGPTTVAGGVDSGGSVVASTEGGGATTVAGDGSRRWNRLEPEVQQRLNTYVVNHSEHSSAGNLGGVLTYVRIAGHESQD